jgi:release factor glutamine methyltransferase
MAHALGMKRLDLYLQFDRPLLEDELKPIRELLRKRSERTPVAYLVGRKDFFSLPFAVDARVLIPRPETELLVELAIKRLEGVSAPRILDVGTGSGCIAVSVLHSLPEATGVAVDIAPGALEVAAANAETNGVTERLELLLGDLLAPVQGGSFDAVLSNPPYIVRGDPSVEADVREHEPEQALYVAADDPLAVAKAVADQALAVLKPGGFLALEVGAGGAPAARQHLLDAGYRDVEISLDLGGIERIVSGHRAADE